MAASKSTERRVACLTFIVIAKLFIGEYYLLTKIHPKSFYSFYAQNRLLLYLLPSVFKGQNGELYRFLMLNY